MKFSKASVFLLFLSNHGQLLSTTGQDVRSSSTEAELLIFDRSSINNNINEDVVKNNNNVRRNLIIEEQEQEEPPPELSRWQIVEPRFMEQQQEQTLVEAEPTIRRELQSYYHQRTSLGAVNYQATVANPMKGIMANPDNASILKWPDRLPATIHYYKRGMNSVMLDDPIKFGARAYNWTAFDEILDRAAAYRHHAVVRFWIHWPGLSLRLPEHLMKTVDLLKTYGDVIPFYGDVNLRIAIKQFIFALGARYDGDSRLLALQAGFLGSWGEWHEWGCTYKGEDCIPAYVKEELISWYHQAFTKTHIQVRYPDLVTAYDNKFGYHDDSFTYTTVGGKANGGFEKNALFWTMAEINNTTDFWKAAPMGGEVRPENANCFHPSYPAGTAWKQDFVVAAKVTHASFIGWIRGFVSGGVGDGTEQEKARFAHTRLGYNFIVQYVGVRKSLVVDRIEMDVTIRQIGVAPFYYPLFLTAICDGTVKSQSQVFGDLYDDGDEVVVTLRGIPTTPECLNAVELQLDSRYSYVDKPILWAQNTDGRVILLKVPLPNGEAPKPVPAPIPAPVKVVVPPPVKPPMGIVLDQRQPTVPRAVVVPPPLPPVAPGAPRNFARVGLCYLVCADSKGCFTFPMGKDIIPIFDNNVFEYNKLGSRKLSIRCDAANGMPAYLQYNWQGYTSMELTAPYSMRGNVGDVYFNVNYLEVAGIKIVKVKAYRPDLSFVEKVLTFTITV